MLSKSTRVVFVAGIVKVTIDIWYFRLYVGRVVPECEGPRGSDVEFMSELRLKVGLCTSTSSHSG